MGCGSDMVCSLDTGCDTNSECAGFHAPCPENQTLGWIDTPLIAGTLIKYSHIEELQTAINDERTNVARRDSGGPPWACSSDTPGAYSFTGGATGPAVGQLVRNFHVNEIADAINTTPFNVDGNTEGPGTPVPNPLVNVGDVISIGDINTLRAAINVVESNCICDLYCSCDVNCGCFNQYSCACNLDIY
jgi:hypothetical protein